MSIESLVGADASGPVACAFAAAGTLDAIATTAAHSAHGWKRSMTTNATLSQRITVSRASARLADCYTRDVSAGFRLRQRSRALLAITAVATLTLPTIAAPPAAPARNAQRRHRDATAAHRPLLRVTFIDVGQGDGALLESEDGHAALIDAGPPDAARHVREVLDAHHVTALDWLMFSHPHLDHIGAGRAVLGAYRVARVIDPAYPHAIATYDALLERIQQLGISFTAARTHDTLQLGSRVNVDILLPHEPFIDRTRSDVNSNSIVARVRADRVRVLFTGDAERETEQRLLAENRGQLTADVLKVAHHGSRFASSADFLDEVSPRFASISCGAGNDYGHPHAATLRVLENRHVEVHRTDLEGDITLETDGTAITMRGAHPSESASTVTPHAE
jgi:beta-lactamase superfamily II metal-dependent hydrolase